MQKNTLIQKDKEQIQQTVRMTYERIKIYGDYYVTIRRV